MGGAVYLFNNVHNLKKIQILYLAEEKDYSD